MSLTIAVFVYAAAMNLSIATWGPWVSPINAFVLNSVDTVWEEYTEAERKYAAYDSRRAKLDGMKAMAQAHTDAIAQIEALGE